MNLAEVWRHLEEDTRISDAPGRVQRRILPDGQWNFFLGLETPPRNRMLILRVASSSISQLPDFSDSRGLKVRMEGIDVTNDATEVVLTLTDSQHEDLFDLLVQDLVEVAEQYNEERKGLVRFLARLSEWQHLFRQLGLRGLSREVQQGLWGELWVLREVIAPVIGVERAVEGWRGPMGADQDFQLGSVCIEVKTSTAATLDRLTISGEQQLEVPADVVLLLFGLSLDDRAGHGETLPDMIESLRTAAKQSGCLHLVDLRLALCGYDREDSNLYSDVGYSIRSLHPFRVEEGFPRIVSSGLQSGVSNVRYIVSTASCENYRMQMQQPSKLLEGFV